MDVLLTLSPMNNPTLSNILPKHQERAGRMLSLWAKFVAPIKVDGDGDYEDFFEQAARLEATVDSFPMEHIWLTTDYVTAKNLASNETLPVSEVPEHINYGINFRWRPNPEFFDSETKGDLYSSTETFKKFSGRKIIVCGFSLEGAGIEIVDALYEFVEEGHSEVIIKTSEAKKGFWRLPLPSMKLNKEETLKELRSLINQEIDWTLIRYEGSAEAFLVQEVISMTHEYRLFVVGQRVVTGAGCIVEHTPLDNTAIFDTFTREIRLGTPSEVVNSPELVAQFVEFAETIVESSSVEEPNLKNYVVDVALGPNGFPVMIERNGFSNAGLYACDVHRITEELSVSAVL